MTEQRVARALTIAATAAAITAAIVAHIVLNSRSGTHFALMAFLPWLVVPGLVPWLWPRSRTFAFWGVFSGGASVIWAIAGSPYSYERDLPGWHAVQLTAWLAIGIVVAGNACAAFWFAAREASAEDLATPLARRLRRIVQLVLPIAAVISVVGLLPGERVYFGDTFLHERSAGGGWLVLFLALALAPATIVYRDPRPRWVWIWMVWTLPTGFLVAAASFDLNIFEHPVPMWPMHVVRFGISMIFVLLLLVMPIVALASRGADEPVPPTKLPEARLRP